MRSIAAAKVIAKRIERDDPKCIVNGICNRGAHSYEIHVTDTRTGYTFAVWDVEQWEERVKAVEFAAMMLELKDEED